MNLAQQSGTPLLTRTISSTENDVTRAIMRTLAYSDLFDYPLTVEEIWRYQAGTCFPIEKLREALSSGAMRDQVSRSSDFYALRGREEVFETRRQRAEASRAVWRRARVYGRILSHLPFVRMVAVTGALAMDNLGDRPDIDFMVVAEAGRVWICRRLIVGLVRLARIVGDEICPNYIIADSKLEIDQRDLFTSHELAQMVPLAGPRVYRALLSRNTWATRYLPVAFSRPFATEAPPRRRHSARVLEQLLRLRPLDRWESWEMKRLRRKLRPLIGRDAEVICSPEQCKGHTGRHRHWITTRYEQRLAELGIAAGSEAE